MNFSYNEFGLKLNLKKYLLLRNNKTRWNVNGGVGMSLVRFRHLPSDWSSNKNALVANAGLGYGIGSRVDLKIQYYGYFSKEFKNSLGNMKGMNSVGLDVVYYIRKNWTFSKIGKYR